MKRRLLLSIAAAGAMTALAACGGSAQPAAAGGDPQPTAAASATATAAPSAASSPVATTSVAITNFTFSPAVITVKAGSAVTWTNKDEEAHTVALNGQPVSQPLNMDDTYMHTFAQPGSYSYICSIHPFMHGMVVVTAS